MRIRKKIILYLSIFDHIWGFLVSVTTFQIYRKTLSILIHNALSCIVMHYVCLRILIALLFFILDILWSVKQPNHKDQGSNQIPNIEKDIEYSMGHNIFKPVENLMSKNLTKQKNSITVKSRLSRRRLYELSSYPDQSDVLLCFFSSIFRIFSCKNLSFSADS